MDSSLKSKFKYSNPLLPLGKKGDFQAPFQKSYIRKFYHKKEVNFLKIEVRKDKYYTKFKYSFPLLSLKKVQFPKPDFHNDK